MPSLTRYWLLFLLVLVLYGVVEYTRPKPLDWTPSYSKNDKIPFGTNALFTLWSDINSQPVTSLRIPPRHQLENYSVLPARSSYVFINSSFLIDADDEKALLRYVAKGNTVFIATYSFSDFLLPALGVKALTGNRPAEDTIRYVSFSDPLLQPKKYVFPKDEGRRYFEVAPGADILARNEKQQPVFVRVTYGKGQVYLHNLPLAFTNYYVVDPVTGNHAFEALSYLPEQPVFWDEYLKRGRIPDNEKSVFRYIVSQPALRSAYYLSLALLLLFAIFSAKRRQRIIPVLPPPENTSLTFIRTIGNMYYRKRDHANIAEKMVRHFWIYVYERFGISPEGQQDAFERLSAKSGLPPATLTALKTEIDTLDEKWTGDRLLHFSRQLETFYNDTR